jgi:predicted ArsR family transcriptional regulator
MMKTKLDERFFESTRGRIVTLLRGETRTVNDLSAELELTDNAVRAHLLSLERDGLVRQKGMQRGTRKPHFAYELAPAAEHLFPKAYDALLNQLIGVLKGRLAPKVLKDVLREVGRSLAVGHSSGKKASLESRAQQALGVLAALGGSARLVKENRKLFIASQNCPLATAVAEHPEVCQLAEALVTEIVGAPAQEQCDRTGSPRCRFQIGNPS